MARTYQAGVIAEVTAAAIKHHREGLGLTGAALARATEGFGHLVDERYIALIEKRRRACTVQELLVLAAALGVSPAALLVPPGAGPADDVRIADDGDVYRADAVWDWLTAVHPLTGAPPDVLSVEELAGLSDSEVITRVRAAAAAARPLAPPWGLDR